MAFPSEVGGEGQGFVNNSEGATNPHKKSFSEQYACACAMRVESREMYKPSWFALGYFRGTTKELGSTKISPMSVQ